MKRYDCEYCNKNLIPGEEEIVVIESINIPRAEATWFLCKKCHRELSDIHGKTEIKLEDL